MRLSKKATAMAAGVALLMALGSTSAMAHRGNGDDGRQDTGCEAGSKSDADEQDVNQNGLINVGGLNIPVNLALNACGLDIIDDVTGAVLGTAIGGDADGDRERLFKHDFVFGIDQGLLGDEGRLFVLLSGDADVMGGLGVLF